MENQESLTKTLILIISKVFPYVDTTCHMATTSITSVQLIIVMGTYWFYANEIWEGICEKYLFIFIVQQHSFAHEYVCAFIMKFNQTILSVWHTLY